MASNHFGIWFLCKFKGLQPVWNRCCNSLLPLGKCQNFAHVVKRKYWLLEQSERAFVACAFELDDSVSPCTASKLSAYGVIAVELCCLLFDSPVGTCMSRVMTQNSIAHRHCSPLLR